MTKEYNFRRLKEEFFDTSKYEGKSKRYWQLRFYGGAVSMASVHVLDIAVVGLIVDAINAAIESSSTLPLASVPALVGILILYGLSQFIKAIAGNDKVRSAEMLARHAYPGASDSAMAWRRSMMMERHLVVISLLGGVGVCVFSIWLNVWVALSFLTYFSLAIVWSTLVARSFRHYHDWSIVSKDQLIARPYARVLKRISDANRTGLLLRLAGIALFGAIYFVASSGGLRIDAALVLVVAARLVISSAASLTSPLLRLQRADSQAEGGKKHTKLGEVEDDVEG